MLPGPVLPLRVSYSIPNWDGCRYRVNILCPPAAHPRSLSGVRSYALPVLSTIIFTMAIRRCNSARMAHADNKPVIVRLKTSPVPQPCLCLCFGFSQMIMIAPLRLITLHFSQIGLTEDLTFMCPPPRAGTARLSVLAPLREKSASIISSTRKEYKIFYSYPLLFSDESSGLTCHAR